MFKNNPGNFSKSICLALAIVLISVWVFPIHVKTVQAGSGTTIDIPASNTIPTMDGVCNPSEYSDAVQISITVGTNLPFPVYLKHTTDDAYFCFGDASGLPLPIGGADSSVAVYIDRSDDGSINGNNGDDFGVWMPYDPLKSPFAAYWGTGSYNGTDPGGWQAVKHQITGGSPMWQVEFRIPRQTMGGWNHPVGLALFYHWWQTASDDYSWPANGIWGAAQLWANANLTTGKVDIGSSATIPTVDGQCSAPEYADASSITFNTSGRLVTAYLKHSLTDLYVCLTNLAVPAAGQQNSSTAALYIDRAGIGGGAPNANDMSFTITYNGTVQASTGDGAGYTGPDPGGRSIAFFHGSGAWDAEFQINSSTIGNWWSRKIYLSVAQQGVNSPGDDYGWPTGSSDRIPNSWGEANLIDLGSQTYLPLVTR